MRSRITSIFSFVFNNEGAAQEIKLNKEFLKIEKYISMMEKSNDDVSRAPVKWHLLHSLQVINGVIDEAAKSNTVEFNSNSNFKWWYVSTIGKIPRGQVQAPDIVNPSFDITVKDVSTALDKAKLSVYEWTILKKNNFYAHHVLLHLNKHKIKRFLQVHTRHHLRIVRDITRD
ncbi:MAG: hypothetical protein ACI9P5_004122 [Saprospiraceae bacterium]|jgi:hypothetical protein|tara:strand:+ start:1422 stop:1940 length:519 start_codon:yes stop_codon:yes gene_type:complete